MNICYYSHMDNAQYIDNIVSEVVKDIKNISLIDKISHLFLEYNLENELIELYKTEFFYSLNPILFEKIGDIYFNNEKYNEALDAYMNCAEGSDNYSQIFKKLAKVFGLLNDNESKLACLKQVEIIEGNNG